MTSKHLTLILLLTIPGFMLHSPLHAGNDPSLQAAFDKANRLYEEGRYEPAALLYQQVAGRLHNWKIYFNRGNCEYKLGRFLKAKILYLQARKLNPDALEIEHNLTLVNRHFRDAIPPARPDFPTRLGLWMQTALPVNVVNLLLLGSGLLVNLFLFLLLTRTRRRRWLYGLGASLLLLLILGAWQIRRLERLRATDTAVVRVEQTELRSGPGTDQTVFFEVHAGLEVTVREQRRDWLYVTASDQVAGWVERADLQLI